MNEYAAEFQKFLNLDDEDFEEFLKAPYFDRVRWENRIQINQQMLHDAGKSWVIDSFGKIPAEIRNSIIMTTGCTAMRHAWVSRYSWAIPSDQAIEICTKYSPILDFASGGGYWSSLIAKKGGEAVCIDEDPKDKTTIWGEEYPCKEWMPIREGKEACVREYPNHTLMMVWPPYATPMAYNALCNFSGNHVIYVGEGHGGCTGCDSFHETLDEEFVLIEECQIPQYNGIHDRLEVWKRRRPRSRFWTFYKRFCSEVETQEELDE